MNLYARLTEQFGDPARPFIHLPNNTVVSYADLQAKSAQYANALVALGVSAGDRVAVQAGKSVEMLLLYLGCLRAGAVFLPLNPAYTAGELDYFLRDAEPVLFVCDPSGQAAAEALAAEVGGVTVATLGEHGDGSLAERAGRSDMRFATVPREGVDLAAILYTSGTTGRSKGAMLTHDNLASNAATLKDCWRFSEADVLLHALPIFHTHGLFVATNVTLAAGAAMIFLPKFDPQQVLDLLPGATVMMGVPTFYIRLLADPRLDARIAANVRLFISGSAPLSADIHREFRARTGHSILERYGMTETNMNTSNPYDGERAAGTVGPPLPGVDIRIADPDSGRVLPQGEVGVIEIAGPNVFKGYWRKPELTAKEFRADHFISGDLGFIDARGYVSIVGRAKDLIISGGFNIYPAEVEAALDELAEVVESAVVGVPHPDMGEAVIAAVVSRRPDFIDEVALIDALSDRLARYKRPRRIHFVDELPKNTMGKVQKVLLRQRFANDFRSETAELKAGQ